jgi:predicted transposase YdaD
MVYKLANLSRAEIETMLGLDLTEEPRAIREAKQEGQQEGREEERELALQRERRLILRLLTKKIGELDEGLRQQVLSMSFEQLELLGEALLDFSGLANLQAWLAEQG